jgi:uncharacterized protein YydD (DUF2326 family)
MTKDVPDRWRRGFGVPDSGDKRISAANQRLYTVGYELERVEESLQRREEFDLERIAQIFAEVELAFPDSLRRSYEELVDFNRRITADRASRLEELSTALGVERDDLRHRAIITLTFMEWHRILQHGRCEADRAAPA